MSGSIAGIADAEGQDENRQEHRLGHGKDEMHDRIEGLGEMQPLAK
jgi:hypothetical protein